MKPSRYSGSAQFYRPKERCIIIQAQWFRHTIYEGILAAFRGVEILILAPIFGIV